MKVLIVLAMVASAFAIRECPANSKYNSCGTACPLTCDNYKSPPLACILMCNPGCHCDEGYVKSKDGECVKPETCEHQAVQCPANSKYSDCGTACPLTCDNHKNPPKACILMCDAGCHCNEGYVKTNDGQCVKPESCENHAEQCTEHSTYNECGTACPVTCDNYKNPPKACIKMCNPGCHCDEGYAKTKDGRCIVAENCDSQAKVCGQNEKYNECGTSCPLTCDNHRNPPKFCNLMCNIGCECQKGYVKNADGKCVLPNSCPDAEESNCIDEPETGFCRGYFPSWYYDGKSGACKEFIYGGCGGNGNKYGSEEECNQRCSAKSANALDRPDCDKGPETGVCRALIPRFYYDQQEGMCKKFVYGGCGGNRNNFATEFDCYNKCGALLGPSNAACEMEKVVGHCKAAFPRYYFNKQSGECELFIYGGCGGNSNNFYSKDECHSVCVD